jgi:hypothetical protein
MANHNSHSHSSLFLAVSISLLAVVNARPTNSNGSSRHAALAANSLGDGPNARHRVVESLGERRKKALEGSFDVPSRLDWHDAGLLRRVKRDGGAAKKDVKKKGILKRLWARVRKLFNVKKHYLHVKQSLKRRFNKRKTEMKEIEKKLEESKGGSKVSWAQFCPCWALFCPCWAQFCPRGDLFCFCSALFCPCWALFCTCWVQFCPVWALFCPCWALLLGPYYFRRLMTKQRRSLRS